MTPITTLLAFLFTLGPDTITEIDVITDRARLRALDIAVLDAPTPPRTG
jgi:hypothetical protein